MPIQYVNRKGDTYFLHESKTKTGKPNWFFSKKAEGKLAESIPDGYEIYQNPKAQVFLRTIVPTLVTQEEIGTVERGVRTFARLPYFLVEGKCKSITVFIADQETGFLEDTLVSKFGIANREKMAAVMQRHLSYLPHMRFTLVDQEARRFAVERWCFRGSIDDWIHLWGSGDLATMVEKYAPHLGKESFFELF